MKSMRFLAVLGLAVLAGCTASRLVTQQSNPDYVGKSFRTVMVVGVTGDEIVRRTFEDRVAALLDKHGPKGIPAYSMLRSHRNVDEAGLREALARSGAEGVLITRVTRVERQSASVPGATVGVGYGFGGFYGYYAGAWQTVTTAPQAISGPSWTLSETRLFDAKTGALAWTGIVDTRENADLDAALTEYVDIIFQAMVKDRVL